MSKLDQTHLRFAPDILRRLGEELISSPYLGIMELVRNAYDADAHLCQIELINTEEVGGTLRVLDDGIGMDEQAINNGWLVLGSSNKKVASERIKTGLGRSPIGDKGLGRLAALRMGSKATMRTRPTSNPNSEYSIILDWERYDSAETVDDVPLTITESRTSKLQGTEIEIADLRTKLTQRDIEQLSRSLLLMSDPFGTELGFNPILVAPQYRELEKLVKESYFSGAEYRLVAILDQDGKASAQVFDWKNDLIFVSNHSEFRGKKSLTNVPYQAPSAVFELWEYHLSGERFSVRDLPFTLGQLREWLKVAGGVHLYQRGVRVHPYGDAGYDWLDMNLSRAKRGEESPSTNNSIGRVVVSDEEEQLISKTDRTGFIENEAFMELKAFAVDALRWMGRKRVKAAEDRRIANRTDVTHQVTEAQTKIEKVLEAVPATYRQPVENAVRDYAFVREQEAKALREDIQLYRTLSTVGTTVAVFAHEAGKPLTRINKASSRLEKILQIKGSLFIDEEMAELVETIKNSAYSLQSYSNLPIQMLKRSKRNVGIIDVHYVLEGVLSMLAPFLQSDKISVQTTLIHGTPKIHGSIAALECIFVNLITNAIHAVVYARGNIYDRCILIRTSYQAQRLLIQFLDNGSGINGLSKEEIWLPGRTTKENGLGLGLTIVRDAVLDLRGTIDVQSAGETGGAQFSIMLPVKEEKLNAYSQ